MSDRTRLLLMRERVAALGAQPCSLAHEQVLIENGHAQRRSNGAGLAPAVVRVGLCRREIRERQLACAHTGARNLLDEAIGLLAQERILQEDEGDRLRAELSRLSNMIHRTDWEKNASEERYALLLEQANHDCSTPPSLMAEKEWLAGLVAQHCECVDRLRQLHTAVLAHFDAGLDDASTAPCCDAGLRSGTRGND